MGAVFGKYSPDRCQWTRCTSRGSVVLGWKTRSTGSTGWGLGVDKLDQSYLDGKMRSAESVRAGACLAVGRIQEAVKHTTAFHQRCKVLSYDLERLLQ